MNEIELEKPTYQTNIVGNVLTKKQSSISSQRISLKQLSKQILQNVQVHEPAHHVLRKLGDADVITSVQELEKNVRKFRIENTVFLRFLQANEPECLEDMSTSINQQKQAALLMQATERHLGDKSSMRSVKNFASLVMSIATLHKEKEVPKININQKSDLILRDLEEIQAKLNKFKKHAHKIKSMLVAKIEEFDTTKEEIEESVDKLRDLVQSSDPFTLDKFSRFMEEWSKKSRLMADKIRLRYSSLRVQLQKLTVTLNHKQLIGENLQEIDFENLRVENLHLVEDIDKKAHLLLELKKMTGAGNLTLSQHKAVLLGKIREKRNIIEAIHGIEKEIAKSDSELEKTYLEIEQARQKYNKVKRLATGYKAPDVMDYIKSKVEVDNYQKELKILNRRKIIVESALQIEIEKMKKILHCKKEHVCWFQ